MRLGRNRNVEAWLRLRNARANTALWQALGFVAKFQSFIEVHDATPGAAVRRAKFHGPRLHVRGMRLADDEMPCAHWNSCNDERGAQTGSLPLLHERHTEKGVGSVELGYRWLE